MSVLVIAIVAASLDLAVEVFKYVASKTKTTKDDKVAAFADKHKAEAIGYVTGKLADKPAPRAKVVDHRSK
jgi:hypothetical protein